MCSCVAIPIIIIVAIILLAGTELTKWIVATVCASVLVLDIMLMCCLLVYCIDVREKDKHNMVAQQHISAQVARYRRDRRSRRKYSVRRFYGRQNYLPRAYWANIVLDRRHRALVRVGLRPGQRVMTPRGLATVVGVGPVDFDDYTFKSYLYVSYDVESFEVVNAGVDVRDPSTLDGNVWLPTPEELAQQLNINEEN
jgi:hypothetical protein